MHIHRALLKFHGSPEILEPLHSLGFQDQGVFSEITTYIVTDKHSQLREEETSCFFIQSSLITTDQGMREDAVIPRMILILIYFDQAKWRNHNLGWKNHIKAARHM